MSDFDSVTLTNEELADEIAACNHGLICSVCRERLGELRDRADQRDRLAAALERIGRSSSISPQARCAREALAAKEQEDGRADA